MEKEKLIEIIQEHHKWLNNSGGSCADLSDADLSDADLSRADLSRADLRGANLSRAYLGHAYLNRADLSRANLSHADLGHAVSYNQNCPEEGDFIGWKKVEEGYVLKLLACGDRVSPITGRKCRTNKVKVLCAFDQDGKKTNKIEFSSKHDHSFKYYVGEVVEEKQYDPNFLVECSRGIHFFITKQEAMDW